MRSILAAFLLLALACVPASAEEPAPDAQPPVVCHVIVVNPEGGYGLAICIFPLDLLPDPEEPELEA